MKLSPSFLKFVETAFNQYLALDPEMSTRLGELEGKCIGFELTDPEITAFCKPHDKSVTLLIECEQAPDCIIKGTALNLVRMMRSDDPAQSLSAGEIEIIGESRVAQDFSDILKTIEIDWEELISKVVGDFAAHRIGNGVRQVKSWLDETLNAMQLDVSDYLREESGILPTRTEINLFMQDVDRFRSDVDRLDARIKRLEKKFAGTENR